MAAAVAVCWHRSAVAAAVAVCWHRTAMALSPCKLVQQWSVEGGAYGKLIGLDVKPVDTTTWVVPFVNSEKNVDWLLNAVLGSAIKGGLRRTILIGILANEMCRGHTRQLAFFRRRARVLSRSRDPYTRLRNIAFVRSRGQVLSQSGGQVLSGPHGPVG